MKHRHVGRIQFDGAARKYRFASSERAATHLATQNNCPEVQKKKIAHC
jgi:hypothetical protein